MQGCGKSYCRKATLRKHIRRDHASLEQSSQGQEKKGTVGPGIVAVGSSLDKSPFSCASQLGTPKSHLSAPLSISNSFRGFGPGAGASHDPRAGSLHYQGRAETKDNVIEGPRESTAISTRTSTGDCISSDTMTHPQTWPEKPPLTPVYLHQSFAQLDCYHPSCFDDSPPPLSASSGERCSPKRTPRTGASDRSCRQPDQRYYHAHMQRYTYEQGYQSLPFVDGQNPVVSNEVVSIDTPAIALRELQTSVKEACVASSQNGLPTWQKKLAQNISQLKARKPMSGALQTGSGGFCFKIGM